MYIYAILYIERNRERGGVGEKELWLQLYREQK